jgi:hypothetical protein
MPQAVFNTAVFMFIAAYRRQSGARRQRMVEIEEQACAQQHQQRRERERQTPS